MIKKLHRIYNETWTELEVETEKEKAENKILLL